MPKIIPFSADRLNLPESYQTLLDAISEHAGLGLFTTDVNHKITETSNSFAAMLGMEPAAIIGAPLSRLTDENDWPFFMGLIEKIKSGQRKSLELEKRFLAASGQFVWTKITGKLIANTQNAPQLVYIVQDISEQKNIQKESLDNEARLTNSLNTISDGFALFDKDDRLVFFNSRYNDFYPELKLITQPGVSYKQLASRLVFSGQILDARGQEKEYVDFLLQRPKGQSSFIENLYSGKWVLVNQHVGDDGNRVLTFTDVTSLKKKELELERLARAAEEANKIKSQFLAVMSHEVKTPLNGILGMLDLLESTRLDTEQLDYSKIARQSSRILLHLINDILDFTKIESHMLKFDITRVNVPTLFQKCAEAARADAAEKNLELYFEQDGKTPEMLWGDPRRISQIFQNVLSNAVKFTEAGSIQCRMRLVEETTQYATMEMRIADTGIGISPDNHQKIFLPFSQVDSSLTRKFGGTGLGLAISRSLAQMMHGDIQVKGEINKGSEFIITLRLSKHEGE